MEAEAALALLESRGFDEAQVTLSVVRQDEVNIAQGEPSLLRSTDASRLALVGILGGRRASTELSDLDEDAVRAAVDGLLAAARAAPVDAANRVSSGQRARIEKGPQTCDLGLLTDKAAELLDFARRETPKVNVNEALAAHRLVRSRTLTTGGSDLETRSGHLSLGIMGTARDGPRASSFAYSAGDAHELESRHASGYFGIGPMLRDLERSIDTRPIGGKFVGDVVLMPQAVADLVEWLLGQVGDEQLIAGTSLYRDRVGEAVGSKLLTLRSRFDAPGVAPVTPDGFVVAPVEILRQGVLATLAPGFYGSLKTGLAHVPVAATGWELAAGEATVEELVAQSARGALVGRLSMGNPASNGDFSGVIKNSFAIEGGRTGAALSETMITGNVARMLRDVAAASRERIDTGALLLPWLRVTGLHFS